jgi:hypothetical protein
MVFLYRLDNGVYETEGQGFLRKMGLIANLKMRFLRGGHMMGRG